MARQHQRDRAAAILREDTAAVIAAICQAPDVDAGRIMLARHWARLVRDRPRFPAPHDPRVAGLGLLHAPLFDELPVAAAGLRRQVVDGAPVWIGRPAQLLAATKALVQRGLRIEVDAANQAVAVYRGDASVMTLLADADHGGVALAPWLGVHRGAGRLAWFLWACGACLLVYRPALGIAVLVAGLVAWCVQWQRGRRPRAEASQRATLTAAPPPGPYRDGAGRATAHVDAIFAACRALAVPVATRGGDLHIELPTGGRAQVLGAGFGTVDLTRLEVDYDDTGAVAAIAHALSGLAGPVTVATSVGEFVARAPHDLAVWRDDSARADASRGQWIARLELELKAADARL
ncbi:MAG: hypothetical protein JNK64_09700 [Myxococcales bacterium]|nr:hypothetical protein [Myxococcales bacterium]